MADLKTGTTPIPKVAFQEMGTLGLASSSGMVLEKCKQELRWPENLTIYKKMLLDSSVNSAVTAIEDLVSQVEWEVRPPNDFPTEDQKEKTKFIAECMHDMEHTWESFINEVLSMLYYGYSIHEKVWKRRNGYKGKIKSKYSDGLLGWHKLPVRSQDTIYKWLWDKNGRNLVGVEQKVSLVPNEVSAGSDLFVVNKSLPRNKFLHFRHNPKRGNPEGTSALDHCFTSWVYKITLEEFEAIAVSRDMNGIPIFYLPPEYLADDAPEDKKAAYRTYQNIVRNFQANEQAGLILPRYIDPDTKQDIFKFELAGVQGGKTHDTDKIIKRKANEIMMTFLADVLRLGQDGVGSFALASSKTNLLAVKVGKLLNQIAEVINNDLIPQTFRLNGWGTDVEFPKVVPSDIEKESLEELSKYIQRIVSVGAVEKDKALSDYLRSQIKLAPADKDNPMDEDLVGNSESKAGEGFKTAGEGTAKEVGGSDSSADNNDNKA